MKNIEHFVLPEHHNQLYTKEAISSISLTRDIADKINELIDAYNTMNEWQLAKHQEQDGAIRKGILYMKDNLLNTLNDLMNLLLENGYVDSRIEEHISTLIERLDNLLGSVTEGTSTLDAEIIDSRVGYDGFTYANAGTAIRNQVHDLALVAFNAIDTSSYIENQWIRNTNGTVADGDGFRISNPIEITHEKVLFKGDFHVYTGADLINFYSDSTMSESAFLGGWNPSDENIMNEATVPDGAMFMVICTGEEYWDGSKFYFAGERFDIEETQNIILEAITLPAAAGTGYIRSTNGRISAVDGYAYSEPIEITHEKLYFKGKYEQLSGTNLINFYSDNETGWYSFIGSYMPTTPALSEIAIPEGAKYFVISTTTEMYEETTLFFSGSKRDSKHGYKAITDIMYRLMLHDETADPIKIKIIGDSITAGLRGTGYTNDETGDLIYGDNYVNVAGHCWANSLKEYLESKFNCEVLNYGVSGIGSDVLLSKLSTLITDEDDIIICSIGTNDRVVGNDAYTGEARTQASIYKNMNAIYSYAKRTAKEIVFISPIPSSVTDEADREIHCEDIENLYCKLGAEKQIEFIPMHKTMLDYCTMSGIEIDSLLYDGLHPNDTGYDVMFYLITNKLGFTTKRPDATW